MEILQEFAVQRPKLKWISEPDSGYPDAFQKALRMAQGKYIVQCAVSDGFLDKKWLETCVAKMEEDLEISLVWGLTRSMEENGEIGEIVQSRFVRNGIPQKSEFLYRWLNTGFWFPEGNMCIRKEVLEKCLPIIENDRGGDKDMWLEFNYNFEVNGYEPFFLKVEANYGRVHNGSRSQEEIVNGLMVKRLDLYLTKIRRYRRDLVWGRWRHVWRSGNGMKLESEFSRIILLRDRFNPISLEWIFMQKVKSFGKKLLVRVAKRYKLPILLKTRLARRFKNLDVLNRI